MASVTNDVGCGMKTVVEASSNDPETERRVVCDEMYRHDCKMLETFLDKFNLPRTFLEILDLGQLSSDVGLVLGEAVLDLRLNGKVDLPRILLVHSLQVLGEQQHIIIACGHSLPAHVTRVARPPSHNVPLTGDPDPVEAPVGGGHTRLYSGQYTLHGAHGADSQLARGGLQSAVEELTVLLETEVHRHHAASLAITTH